MKSLPIGNEDFKDIRDSNCYYVDKTTMIGEILDNAGTRVFLFTRPRRFRKTLNMSIHHTCAIGKDTRHRTRLPDIHNRSSDGFLRTVRIFRDRLESGLGFADIIMEKKRAFDINVVMELKRCKDEGDPESESVLALKQIEEKEYHYDLKSRTILYGISFCGKEPHILSKVMDL